MPKVTFAVHLQGLACLVELFRLRRVQMKFKKNYQMTKMDMRQPRVFHLFRSASSLRPVATQLRLVVRERCCWNPLGRGTFNQRTEVQGF